MRQSLWKYLLRIKHYTGVVDFIAVSAFPEVVRGQPDSSIQGEPSGGDGSQSLGIPVATGSTLKSTSGTGSSGHCSREDPTHRPREAVFHQLPWEFSLGLCKVHETKITGQLGTGGQSRCLTTTEGRLAEGSLPT